MYIINIVREPSLWKPGWPQFMERPTCMGYRWKAHQLAEQKIMLPGLNARAIFLGGVKGQRPLVSKMCFLINSFFSKLMCLFLQPVNFKKPYFPCISVCGIPFRKFIKTFFLPPLKVMRGHQRSPKRPNFAIFCAFAMWHMLQSFKGIHDDLATLYSYYLIDMGLCQKNNSQHWLPWKPIFHADEFISD